jgi:ABC-type transport system substrate-binding protein
MMVKSVGVANATGYVIKLRMNDPSLPWSNIKVRQALHMAVDYQAIATSYYNGNATVYSFPAPALPESKDFFVTMNELPQNVQDLFKYQPEKAKQMLADAGYSNGFTLEVVCRTMEVDLLSMYKDYYSKIGVNLVVDLKETSVYTSIAAERKVKHAIMAYGNTSVPFLLQDFTGVADGNLFINDARVNQALVDINNAALDFAKQCQARHSINIMHGSHGSRTIMVSYLLVT